MPAEASPLGLPVALHLAVETTIDRPSLLDRLGSLDPAAVEACRIAWTLEGGRRRHRRLPFARRTSRSEAHDGDADQEWWPLDTASHRADLLKAVHRILGESHPAARIAPRPSAIAGFEHLSAVALVAELDAFVLVAALDHPLDDPTRLEAARQVLHADQLLNAVCLVEPSEPFLSVVIDRRDVVAAIETPSGELRPPRQSRPPAPVGVALSKFLDATISPFGRLARTFVEGQALDPRELAVDVSADAVRTIQGSAKGFKTEGQAARVRAGEAAQGVDHPPRRGGAQRARRRRGPGPRRRTNRDPPTDTGELAGLRAPGTRLLARGDVRGGAQRRREVVDRRGRPLRSVRLRASGPRRRRPHLPDGRHVRVGRGGAAERPACLPWCGPTRRSPGPRRRRRWWWTETPREPGTLDALLVEEYGADPAFLARLAMLHSSTVFAEAKGLDLRDHLCRVFGVDGLMAALDQTKVLAAVAKKTVDSARKPAAAIPDPSWRPWPRSKPGRRS